MAFPTIPTAAAGRVLSTLATNPAGTHTSPNLSSLTKNAGDLLIAIVIIYDGNSTNAEFSSWGGGFTEFADQAGTATMGIGCAYKWSTGSETGTFTATSADTSANDSAFFLLSIPGAHASTPPEAGTMATGTSAAADPGSFNPAGWDAEDTLWIAVAGSGETSTTGSYTGIASAPTNFTDYADSGISADAVGGVEGAVAFRQLNASSLGVGTFSVDVSNARNAALVIAVRPAAAVNTTITADQGTYTLTGQAATPHYGRSIVAAQGSYTLTGQSAHLQSSKQQGYFMADDEQLLVADDDQQFVTDGFIDPLAAAHGVYTYTGQAATLKRALALTAAQGSYALTGQAATLRRGVILTAAQGSYSLTGQDVAFKRTYTLPAAQGSYALAGQAATLKRALTISAAQGSYTYTGQAATLVRGARLTAAQGTYALTGQAVQFKRTYTMPAEQGTYSVTGQAATLKRALTLTAAQGSYALAGQAATLKRALTLTAAQGSYALTGQAVNLTAQRLLTAANGIYVVSGQDVTLTKSSANSIEASFGTYALSGQSVAFELVAASAGGAWMPTIARRRRRR